MRQVQLNTAGKIQLAARIRAMDQAGIGAATIAKRLARSIEIVERVLAGKGVDSYQPIRDMPTIQGTFDKNGWPVDEEATTESIYAAAEAIRERRPRHPIGYTPVSAEVVRGSIDVQALPRGGRSRL